MRVVPVRSASSVKRQPALVRVGWLGGHQKTWLPIVIGLALYGLSVVLRLWGLTQSVTADDQDWVRRAVDFAGAVERREFRETYQSAHPGVPVLWIAALVIGPRQIVELERRDSDRTTLEKSPAYLPALFAVRRALASYAAALIVAIAFLVGRLFTPGLAVLVGLLLAAEPFLVAHSQAFSTDVLLSELMVISVLAAVVYFGGRGGRAYLAASGLAAGLAFSTKAPAIMLFGFIPLVALLLTLGNARARGHGGDAASGATVFSRPLAAALVADLLCWALLAGLIYIAIWPALWVDPVGTLVRLERQVRGIGESPRRWGNFFLGQITTSDDVALLLRPIFYPVVTALRLSPLTFVGLLVLAGACIARGRGVPLWGSSAARHAAVLAGYVALFTVMMTVSPKKLDRYLLPAYPALVILGALGLWLVIQRWVPSRLRWLTVAALGACQIALIASVQPYPLSFYNPLLGGGMVAQEAMIVGWGEGLDQVAEYLNGQPNASQIVVVSLYKDQIVPLFPGGGARLEDWRRGNYLATYINMDQRNLLPGPLSELVATTPPEFTVRINSIRYARVYRISPEIRNQSGSQPGPRPNAVPRP